MKVQLHAPATLPRGKSTQYEVDRRLGGLQSWCEGGSEDKTTLMPLTGIEPRRVVTTLTELLRLQCKQRVTASRLMPFLINRLL